MLSPTGKTLLVARLAPSTPIMAGGYEPGKVDRESPIRPSSIKGVWRWTARALAGGVLYDLGLLCGGEGGYRDYMVRYPTRREVKAVSKIVGSYMGLGTVDGDKAEASRFIVDVETLRKPRIGTTRGRIKNVPVHRARLLGLKGGVEFFEEGEFKVSVSLRRSERRDYENVAVKALLIALNLVGLGKGSRKAIGSLDVIQVAHGVGGGDLRSLVEESYEDLRSLVEDDKGRLGLESTKCSRGLPPFPVIAKEHIPESLSPDGGSMVQTVTSIYKINNVGWAHMHDFFLRAARSRKLGGDPLRQKLRAWILGLPRAQQKLGTGYFIGARDVSRRASPIIMAYHSERHRWGDGLVVTAIASGDWPKEITWRRSTIKPKRLQVDEREIVKALDDALSALNNYVGGKLQHGKIWP